MSERILIVEDDPHILKLIQYNLEKAGFECRVAGAATQAFEELERQKFHLIVLDIMLPGGMDGFELCKEIRKKPVWAAIPVLMLTARAEEIDRIVGLSVGADDYLVKPFSFEELLARIRALLRRPEHALDTTLRIANLELNTGTFEVRRGKVPIELSRKEFALLEYLMRNQGRILSKEQIITHVWDFDADILPNTVEAFIASLRQKVDRPFKGPKLINTVRGFGYRLSA